MANTSHVTARQLVTLGEIGDLAEAARYATRISAVEGHTWAHFEELDREFDLQHQQLIRLVAGE